MKAISILQPWATLIVLGEKRIETRSWSTSHRGPLLIQASKSMRLILKEICGSEPFRSILKRHRIDINDLPTGQIIGQVEVVDCLPTEKMEPSLTEYHLGDFGPKRYGFVLANATPLAVPIHCRGNLGLWDASSLIGEAA